MALNYPRLDNASGIWNMKEVTEAVLGGYWPNSGARGLFGGGYTPTYIDTIDYITISSTGDAADFGNLTTVKALTTSQSSSFTRAVFWAGDNGSDISNVIRVVTAHS